MQILDLDTTYYGIVTNDGCTMHAAFTTGPLIKHQGCNHHGMMKGKLIATRRSIFEISRKEARHRLPCPGPHRPELQEEKE